MVRDVRLRSGGGRRQVPGPSPVTVDHDHRDQFTSDVFRARAFGHWLMPPRRGALLLVRPRPARPGRPAAGAGRLPAGRAARGGKRVRNRWPVEG
jgi:hypothetical protein